MNRKFGLSSTELAPADDIARKFAEYIKRDIGEPALMKAVLANDTESNIDICHTHDYTDANMQMAEAFEEVVGRTMWHEPDQTEGRCTERDVYLDYSIWNDAWQSARLERFYVDEGRMQKLFESAGWVEENTGGGCMAYIYVNQDKSFYMATVYDDADVPHWGDKIFIGAYDAEGEWLDERGWTFKFAPDVRDIGFGDLDARSAYYFEFPVGDDDGCAIEDAFHTADGRFATDCEHYGMPYRVAALLAVLNGYPFPTPRQYVEKTHHLPEGALRTKMPSREEIQALANEAMNVAVRHIQDRLGVKTGDYAGMFFSGEMNFEWMLRDYAAAEAANVLAGDYETDAPVQAKE